MSDRRRTVRRAVATLAIAVGLAGALGAPPAGADTPPSGRLLFIPTSPATGAMIRDKAKSALAIGSGAQAVAGTFSSATGSDVLVYSPGAGADYIASKAGVAGLTRSLALTAGPQGITVNTVNPGMIETPMLAGNHGGDMTSVVAERSAVRRLGRPDELAALVVMLASEQAGFVTGAHLDANGGYYLG